MKRVPYKKTPIPEKIAKLELTERVVEDKRIESASVAEPILCRVWDDKCRGIYKMVVGIYGPYYRTADGTLYKYVEIVEKTSLKF